MIGEAQGNIFYGDFSNNDVKIMKLNIAKGNFLDNTIHSIQNTKIELGFTSSNIGVFNNNIINFTINNCRFFIDVSNFY